MCPKLPHIPYGRVYTDGLKPGSTATYHCEHGYSLNSYKKRICDNYGTWTYWEPTCDSKYLVTSQMKSYMYVRLGGLTGCKQVLIIITQLLVHLLTRNNTDAYIMPADV